MKLVALTDSSNVKRYVNPARVTLVPNGSGTIVYVEGFYMTFTVNRPIDDVAADLNA